MRIITGKLKGMNIPFKNKKYKDADVTTDKVKEALFDIIGSSVYGSSFMDLYGCSGQIGFEAFSRGACSILINENNKDRFDFIKNFDSKIDPDEKIILCRMSDFECINYAGDKSYKFDYIFLDPPYPDAIGKNKYEEIVLHIMNSLIMNDDATIIIQHQKNITPKFDPEKCRRYNYGSNSLTFIKVNN